MKILLDTTYLLPLIRINIKGFEKNKLLELTTKHKTCISNISIMELSAKGAKHVSKNELEVTDVLSGLKALIRDDKINIIDTLDDPEILEISIILRKHLNDFIDCLILGTALLKTDVLLTEDADIHKLKKTESFEGIKKQINSKFKIQNLTELNI